MEFRKTAIALTLAAATAVGVTTVATTAPEAHAVTLYGLCTTNGNAYCARETSGFFDYWARDISGDTNQQMSRSYQGQVSSSRCWPFTCGSGFNARYNGASVWKIFNIHTGHCVAGSNVSDYQIRAGACTDTGTNWVWPGNVNNSDLINVYQTNLYGLAEVTLQVSNSGLYHPLITSATFPNYWGLVPVIG